MKAYTDQLLFLARQLPETVTENDLPHLEEMATAFEHLLKLVHNHDHRMKTHTQYYYERVQAIESALDDGKYGRDQKRRNAGCRKARRELASAIDALTRLVQQRATPAASNS